MSLEKAINNGKEKRRKYRGAKAIDPSCRNHGGCEWCEGNRKHKYDKSMKIAEDIYDDWENDEDDDYVPFWEEIEEDN